MAPGPLRHSWNWQVVHLFNLSNLSSGGTFFLTQRFSKMPWPDSMETRFLIGLSQQRCKIIQNRQTRLSKGQCTTVQTSMMTSSKWNALSCSKSSAVPFIDQCSSCWKQNKLYTTGNPVPSGSVFTQAAGKQTNFSSFGSPTVQRVQGLKHQNHVENGHWFKAAQLLRWSQMISDYLSASQLLHPSPNFSVPLCFSMVKRREFGPSIRSCHSWWKLLREGVPPYPPLVQVAVRKQKKVAMVRFAPVKKRSAPWSSIFEHFGSLVAKLNQSHATKCLSVTTLSHHRFDAKSAISVESPSNLRRISVESRSSSKVSWSHWIRRASKVTDLSPGLWVFEVGLVMTFMTSFMVVQHGVWQDSNHRPFLFHITNSVRLLNVIGWYWVFSGVFPSNMCPRCPWSRVASAMLAGVLPTKWPVSCRKKPSLSQCIVIGWKWME